MQIHPRISFKYWLHIFNKTTNDYTLFFLMKWYPLAGARLMMKAFQKMPKVGKIHIMNQMNAWKINGIFFIQA